MPKMNDGASPQYNPLRQGDASPMARAMEREGFVYPTGIVSELQRAFDLELPTDCKRMGPSMVLISNPTGMRRRIASGPLTLWFKSPFDDLSLTQIAQALEDYRNERSDVTYCDWNCLRHLLKHPDEIRALVALRSLR